MKTPVIRCWSRLQTLSADLGLNILKFFKCVNFVKALSSFSLRDNHFLSWTCICCNLYRAWLPSCEWSCQCKAPVTDFDRDFASSAVLEQLERQETGHSMPSTLAISLFAREDAQIRKLFVHTLHEKCIPVLFVHAGKLPQTFCYNAPHPHLSAFRYMKERTALEHLYYF